MAGRTQRFLFITALIAVAASCLYIAASGDSGKPADKSKKKGAAPAATPAAQAPAAAPGPGGSDGAPANPDPASPVAVIGDHPITLQDLALKLLNRQEFEQRKQALDEMITDTLLEKEAAAKGVLKEKLVETEVVAKVPEPAQKEIDDWFEKNKANVGGQTKEQIGPQIGALLKSQKLADAQRAYMATLRQKYAVKVMMEPPRIAVSVDDDASKGPEKAPVTIVEFSDYQCPFCSRAESTVDEVLKKYGDKVRLVYRDYPLTFHQNAESAAEAAECAKDQGKFWEMHNAMFANQAKLSSADLVETAGGLGIDKEKFKACLDSGKMKAEVQKDFQDGQKYGVTGTPTFFINGLKLVGARDLSSFTEIIDQELQRKN